MAIVLDAVRRWTNKRNKIGNFADDDACKEYAPQVDGVKNETPTEWLRPREQPLRWGRNKPCSSSELSSKKIDTETAQSSQTTMNAPGSSSPLPSTTASLSMSTTASTTRQSEINRDVISICKNPFDGMAFEPCLHWSNRDGKILFLRVKESSITKEDISCACTEYGEVSQIHLHGEWGWGWVEFVDSAPARELLMHQKLNKVPASV
eukprot:symbB.v1.2.034035.t1/scaffold4321.1/size41272/2